MLIKDIKNTLQGIYNINSNSQVNPSRSYNSSRGKGGAVKVIIILLNKLIKGLLKSSKLREVRLVFKVVIIFKD